MKKIFSATALLLSVALFITSCATDTHQNGEEKNTANGSDNILSENASGLNEAENYKNIVFECSFLQDQSSSYKETGFYFSDCEEAQGSVSVQISADYDLNSFKIVELEFDENNGEVKLCNKNTLFTVKTLPKDTDFVFNTIIIGTIPNRGICFTDADDKEHIYALTTSGMDGSVLLDEITD